MDTSRQVVVGLAMQLCGFPLLLLGGFIAPHHTRVLCTVEKVAARLCSFDEHNALMYGGALMGLGAIVFLVGLGLDRAGRR